MRILVLGAGALGSWLGAVLSRQHDVTLVGRAPHVEAINATGLRVTGATVGVFRIQARTGTRGLAAPDLVLLCTKAHGTVKALDGARNVLGPGTRVLSLQNGLGNLEAIADAVGPERTVGGTITTGVTMKEPGAVHHAGAGEAVVGPWLPRRGPVVKDIADALQGAGIPCSVVDDVRPALFAKVGVNAAINPITAITGLPNGAVADLPALRALAEAVAGEVEEVARATGIAVEPGTYAVKALDVARKTAGNRSSMLQDLERGRRTEIDQICGAVVRLGEEAGVATPRLSALHALVAGIEATLRYDG